VSTCGEDGTFGPCQGEVIPTTDACETALDEDCDGVTSPCPGGYLWSARFGDASDQAGNDVVVDSAGRVYLGGKVSGSIDFGGGVLTAGGGADGFVAAFDADLTPRWGKLYGDASAQNVTGLAVDGQDDLLVAGQADGAVDFGGATILTSGGIDAFVAKLAPDGTATWAKSYGDASDQGALAVAADSNDNIVLVGYFAGSMTFGPMVLNAAPGGADAFVAKLAANGDAFWAKRAGDGADQRATSVAIDSNDNIIVVGGFYGVAAFGGVPLQALGAEEDAFVVKYDPAGNHVWSKRFGGTQADAATSVAIGPNDEVYVTGRFLGNVDFGGQALQAPNLDNIFLITLDAQGTVTAAKGFGDGAYQAGTGVAVDALGNVLLAGTNAGVIALGAGITSAGLGDVFVGKFDAFRNSLWSRGFGDSEQQAASAIAVDPSGAVLITGYLSGSVDLGGGLLPGAADNNDVFLLRLAP
jgi:hypothetical protein